MSLGEYDAVGKKTSLHTDTIYKKKKSHRSDIIGLPPIAHVADNHHVVHVSSSSMPVASFYPMWPTMAGEELGLKLYNLDFDLGKAKYAEILNDMGLEKVTVPVQIAFLNDVAITDSVISSFGESKFEEVGNNASSLLSDIRLVTGSNSGGEGLQALASKMHNEGGVLASIAGAGVGAAGWVTEQGEGLLDAVGEGLGKILSGSKINFPKVWRGTSFDPTYTLTVRLYNPNTNSEQLYFDRIVKPLMRIMALCLPVADSKYTYHQSLMAKIDASPLFKIQGGYISSMEIIKGGDSNDISWKQRPNTVDVRLTVQSLYNSLIHEPSDKTRRSDKPTFRKYINDMFPEYKGDENEFNTTIKENQTFTGRASTLNPESTYFKYGRPEARNAQKEARDRVAQEAADKDAQLKKIKAILSR